MQIGTFARLGSLTLVMKGEGIPAHSQWAAHHSAPAQKQAETLLPRLLVVILLDRRQALLVPLTHTRPGWRAPFFGLLRAKTKILPGIVNQNQSPDLTIKS